MKILCRTGNYWLPPTQLEFTILPTIRIGRYDIDPTDRRATWDAYLAWGFWTLHVILAPAQERQSEGPRSTA